MVPVVPRLQSSLPAATCSSLQMCQAHFLGDSKQPLQHALARVLITFHAAADPSQRMRASCRTRLVNVYQVSSAMNTDHHDGGGAGRGWRDARRRWQSRRRAPRRRRSRIAPWAPGGHTLRPALEVMTGEMTMGATCGLGRAHGALSVQNCAGLLWPVHAAPL